MSKKNIGATLALYPCPVIVVGAMVNDKPTWTLVAHAGTVAHSHLMVSLAWLLTKVTSPVVGATKMHHIEGAAKAVDLTLTPEEIVYLEEPYVPHPLAGVMAQNKPAAAKEKHVWSTGDQKIGK